MRRTERVLTRIGYELFQQAQHGRQVAINAPFFETVGTAAAKTVVDATLDAGSRSR